MNHLTALCLLLFAATAMADEPVKPLLRLPCEVVDVYDGDTLTVEVRVPIKVRLMDCWAPEVTGSEKPDGIKSRDHLRSISLGKEGLLEIPIHGKVIGDVFSFNRLVGRVLIDGGDLSVRMVEDGFATGARKTTEGPKE